jgi:predicted phosphodiesterase
MHQTKIKNFKIVKKHNYSVHKSSKFALLAQKYLKKILLYGHHIQDVNQSNKNLFLSWLLHPGDSNFSVYQNEKYHIHVSCINLGLYL